MASGQADGTLVAQCFDAATLSIVALTNVAAAILKAATQLRWRVAVVVRFPGRILLPLRLWLRLRARLWLRARLRLLLLQVW